MDIWTYLALGAGLYLLGVFTSQWVKDTIKGVPTDLRTSLSTAEAAALQSLKDAKTKVAADITAFFASFTTAAPVVVPVESPVVVQAAPVIAPVPTVVVPVPAASLGASGIVLTATGEHAHVAHPYLHGASGPAAAAPIPAPVVVDAGPVTPGLIIPSA